MAIREGRRIFDNIRKFTNYLLSTSLGEVFVVLMLSIAGYFPLSAIMLLWINVITDLIPASALAADPAVSRVMERLPRRYDEPILNKAIYATIAGSIFRPLIAYGLIFWAGLQLGGIDYARAMLFTSIVLHAFTHVMVVRQLDDLSILVQQGVAGELCSGGWLAASGFIHTFTQLVWYRAFGLARLARDDPGRGRLFVVRCLYDALDIEARPDVGIIAFLEMHIFCD